MLDVLFIAIEFPPINTTGNFRSLKFVKYLRDYGINPIVLTLDPVSGKNIFQAPIEYSLLNEVPDNIKIYRHPILNFPNQSPNKLIRFFNQFFRTEDIICKYWANDDFWKLIKKIEHENNIKAIYVSLPPVSAGGLAIKIAKKFNLPLIVDMRDAWSQWCSSPFPTYIHYLLIKHKERKLFEKASKIISVTDELAKSFQSVHPKINPSKFITIPNGYDEQIDSSNISNVIKKNQRPIFRIGYVGSFYYSPESQAQLNKKWWQRKGHRFINYVSVKQDWTYRSPYFFLKTLVRLFEKYPQYKDVVSFEHIGHTTHWLPGMIEDFGLTNIFKSHGFMSYPKTKELLQEFDALLATSELTIGGSHYCLPSKVFDYIYCNKPILGFVTEGSQKEFLKKSGLAIIFEPDNEEISYPILKDIIDNGVSIEINLDFISSFKRSETAKRLAQEIIKLST